MFLKSTESPFELERTVSKLRNEIRTSVSSIHVGSKAKDLLKIRDNLRQTHVAANNAILCSVLYSNDNYRQQLEGVRSSAKEHLASIEMRIQKKIKPSIPESMHRNLHVVMEKIAKEFSCDSVEMGYTALLDGESLVPVRYARFHNIIDQSNYTHPMFTVWFKNTKEFCTGFAAWPPVRRWSKIKNNKEIESTISIAMLDDSFKTRSLA